MLRQFIHQLYTDTKNVQHDIFLLYLMPIPLLLATVFPYLYDQIDRFFGDILLVSRYNVLFTTYIFLILPPLLWGTVFGFLIINEKDLRTLDAIRVTPSGLKRLVYNRLIAGITISMAVEILSFAILQYKMTIELFYLIILASIFTPLLMLVMTSIAKNKVQAFAIMKGTSSFFVIPFIYLIVPRIEFVFYLIPSYWIVKPLVNEYYAIETGIIFYSGALLSQLIWLLLLNRVFQRSLE